MSQRLVDRPHCILAECDNDRRFRLLLISTILLNWNRAVLLEQTLRSYAETVTEPFELIVVDNASDDDSRKVIDGARRYIPELQVLLLDDNIGGEAFNLGLERISGELIHLSENDYLYLVGWSDHVRDAFRCFPDLGQLSLLRGIRPDRQPGAVQPADLRFAQGKILYEARNNVITTSVLRSSLFHDHAIRVHNIPRSDPNHMLLPADGRLSAEVRTVGYWCAWSDRDYTRSLGHEIEEFDRDPEYYFRNYASKPWIGIEGWRKRNAELATRLVPMRRSTAFPAAELQPERTIRNIAGKSAQLWSMFDAWTAETEVLDFLYALVHMVKPRSVIETGTWLGRSAIAIASALRDNGFGHATTIEINPEAADVARRNIEEAGLTKLVSLHVGNVLEFEPSCNYDFGFFDSGVLNEFGRLRPYLEAGSILVFQNLLGAQESGAAAGKALTDAGYICGLAFDTPRGLFVGKLLKPAAGRDEP